MASRAEQWLVDKSAYQRLADSTEVDVWLARLQRGLLRVAAVTVLELGYSARGARDWDQFRRRPPLSLMPPVFMSAFTESRAIEVQGLLAARGHHRGPGVSDLILAAIAEEQGLTLLHVDRDFELIAEVTGQPIERLAGEF
ncbi:PIN domain nuclease [Flexivirga caeni]|uniref:Ribonuclease VapC n=1 Tax=Flexivirga caeni TaxID=2294115 RepID=A0A3M9MGG2_9MICO|nr:PIN domain nuclease [Flexivirga caeni]RNI24247.1 PIN domain nuclease [Flexivirga caeni]